MASNPHSDFTTHNCTLPTLSNLPIFATIVELPPYPTLIKSFTCLRSAVTEHLCNVISAILTSLRSSILLVVWRPIVTFLYVTKQRYVPIHRYILSIGIPLTLWHRKDVESECQPCSVRCAGSQVPDWTVQTSVFRGFTIVDRAKALLRQRWNQLQWQGVTSYAEVHGSLLLYLVN